MQRLHLHGFFIFQGSLTVLHHRLQVWKLPTQMAQS